MCGRQSCVSGLDSGSVLQMRKLVTGSLHTCNRTHNLTQPHTIAIQPYTIIHMCSHRYTDTQPHTVIHNHILSMTQPYTIMPTCSHTQSHTHDGHTHNLTPTPHLARSQTRRVGCGSAGSMPHGIDRSALEATSPARQILHPMVMMHETWITGVQVHKGFSSQPQSVHTNHGWGPVWV